jgi:hypothetical protein
VNQRRGTEETRRGETPVSKERDRDERKHEGRKREEGQQKRRKKGNST